MATDTLALAANSIEIRNCAKAASAMLAGWGLGLQTSGDKLIFVNCNEMMRAEPRGECASDASEMKCSLASESSDRLIGAELARTDEMLGVARRGSAGWAEDGSKALSRRIGMTERRSKKKFEGQRRFRSRKFCRQQSPLLRASRS